MYISPIIPDEYRQCFECTHCTYDTYYDESWCDVWHHSIDSQGTCEQFESWKEHERKRIKQLRLFKDE